MLAIVLGLISLAGLGCAGPGPRMTANDTGGMIAWSPEIDPVYHDMAAAHCARWNRIAKITSAHRWEGDYIAFVCLYDRQYDPRKAWLSQ
jgi:hypothetical protein